MCLPGFVVCCVVHQGQGGFLVLFHVRQFVCLVCLVGLVVCELLAVGGQKAVYVGVGGDIGVADDLVAQEVHEVSDAALLY